MGITSWFRYGSETVAQTRDSKSPVTINPVTVQLAYKNGRPISMANAANGQEKNITVKNITPHASKSFQRTGQFRHDLDMALSASSSDNSNELNRIFSQQVSPSDNTFASVAKMSRPSDSKTGIIESPTYHSGEDKAKGWKKLPHWKKIPQWINRFWFLVKSQPTRHEDYLDYDPFYLRIFTNQRYNAYGDQFYLKTLRNDKQLFQRLNQKEMDLETFKLVLEQVPAVRTVEFSGRGEPLLNPDLLSMIQYAHQFNGAETIVVTNGLLLQKNIHAILNSRLSQLCINLYGHKPSTYHQMSGLDAHNFVPMIENIKQLVSRKSAMGSHLKIIVSMTADVHTFRTIPEMIVLAHDLGVDGVVINNYLPDDPEIASERTLYSDQHIISEFFTAIESRIQSLENFEVTLPVLMDRDMSGHRHCQEAFTTVAVDGNCSVYPCSRQLLSDELGETPKIWEPDFWNHTTYHHLRNIHSSSTNGNGPEVPNACRHCPRNVALSH
ncbi:MAG: hypothetical protein VKJ04_00605 [Vampirovibrionales bacterium]|nr:hypothetical protein [Vampirovibrionales bacterium]